MVDGQKKADKVMAAASKEAIGLLMDEAKDHVDEELEETREEAKEKAEEKAEQEKKIDERKESQEEVEVRIEENRRKNEEQEELGDTILREDKDQGCGRAFQRGCGSSGRYGGCRHGWCRFDF